MRNFYLFILNSARSVFLFLALLISLAGFSQADKIDPVFRYIITHRNNISDPLILRDMPSPDKIQPTDGVATPGGPLEKRYDCIVYTKNAQALKNNGIVVRSVLPTFVTAWVTIDQLEQMAAMTDVTYIKTPEMLGLHNDVVVGNSGASLLHQGRLNNTVYKGKGVLVAIFDTGIDWDHPDFRNATDQTKSRILRIWDQTITPTFPGEVSPSGMGYGVEFTQTDINDELDGSPTGFVREQDVNGHGTHVAGTAAGNGMALTSRKYAGMAPEADIIIVKGGNGSFSSTNVINAMTYLQALSTSLGKPIVLNMSLGGQSGPHDGTSGQEAAVNSFTSSSAGRAVVISAGNDNGTNIHNQFTINPAATGNVTFAVPSASSGADVFQYTVYANDNTNVTAVVTAPSAEIVTATAGQSVGVAVMGGNFTVNLSNGIDAGSGDRFVNVYITRSAGNPTGTWTLSITNNGGSTITMDGWLNYKATAYAATTVSGGNSLYLVGSPGTASSAITVASFVGKLKWNSITSGGALTYNPPDQQDGISSFSSIGPRRDNVLKPEITADGQAVISCLSSNMTGADVVVTGFYHREQGTSMSAPAVTGAVALLLQAKPTATASEVKGLLTAAANTDVLTGAAPNNSWGYGRLDVFKAATSIFNCTPVERRTYQYDNSYTTGTDFGGTALTTQRIAVRTTPDISGKLGGFFYHSSASITDLVAEVRTNSAGNPGTLLGTLAVPVGNLGLSVFNYIDLSSLNITVTNATDFFIILYRSTASGWSVRSGPLVAGRSLLSTDNGGSWSAFGSDLRIRAVVYNHSQIAGGLATSNSVDTRDLNTSNQFFAATCKLIAQLAPDGTPTTVGGTVTTNVWLEGAVPHVGTKPFVSRHYQIMPSTNAATASGIVTLYFTQAEFTAFNADAGSVLDMPIDAADVANNKANIRVGKYPGTSSNGSGMPNTYPGPGASVITPTSVVWNADASRWEVTFTTTGFSGFILQTSASILPVSIEYFTGKKQSDHNILNWKVSCTSDIGFEIQRSLTGANNDFTSIGVVAANQQDCSQPFVFTDVLPLAGKNYYRIKITEINGRVYYTSIILLQRDKVLVNTVYPTILSAGDNIQVGFVSGPKGVFQVNDVFGRQVFTYKLINGVQSFKLSVNISGLYYYEIKDESGERIASGKLVVQ